jgi:hypothetical protein
LSTASISSDSITCYSIPISVGNSMTFRPRGRRDADDRSVGVFQRVHDVRVVRAFEVPALAALAGDSDQLGHLAAFGCLIAAACFMFWE